MHRAVFLLLILAPAAAAQNLPTSGIDEEIIWEEPEVWPTLIGGLDSLSARVVYPEAVWRDGVGGMVVVQFVVTEAGRVEAPEVLQSPDDRLSEAALAAILASRFEPGRHRGRPVKVRFVIPITFRLGGPASGDG